MRFICLCMLLLAVASITAFGQTPEPRFEDLVRQFDYDPKSPLDVREVSRRKGDGGVTIIDLTCASPRGGRIPAYLVVPPATAAATKGGRAPFAAVLFGHWMMPGSPLRNRRQFLEEAVVLARSGAVSLLIDAPLVRPGFVAEQDELRAQVQSVEASRQQVIDFRRGVDLLVARQDVDPARIAYVGHSYDAHIGGILSGVEKRIGSFVLLAGGFASEEYVFDPDNPAMQKARRRIGEKTLRDFFRKYAYDDPVHFVGHSAPASVFLQFGTEDKPIPEKLARHYYALFSEPKKIAFYQAGHALNAAARAERVQWLIKRLALRPVDKSALARIPELK